MIHLLGSTDLWFRTLQASTTLLFVALGGYLALRAGVLLLGLEGQLLLGCLFAVVCAERSGDVWLGILGGVGGSLAVGVIVMLLVVVLRGNDVVVGLAVNVAGAGVAGMLVQGMYGHRGGISSPRLRPLPDVPIPGLDRVPWVGHVLSGQTILTYAGWIVLCLSVWWLSATVSGLTVRVAGLRGGRLASAGRSVVRVRCLTILASSVCVGLGAAQLALGEAVGFQEGMSGGRGFIALVLVFLAGVRPWLIAPLTVCFAWFEAMGLSAQTVGLPAELSDVVPYVAVFVLLLLSRAPGRRRRNPLSGGLTDPVSADGRPQVDQMS
jgi:simple sugar transport system permease protein